MRKIILTALAVFAFGFTNAQEVKYGVKGGLNISNQKFEAEGASMTANSIVGVQVGGFAEIKVADKFAVQPEILFSTEGSKINSEGMSFTINTSYINVPVMAKFYPSEKISFEAGPQIGLLVGANVKSGGEKEDFKDALKTTNFGVNFGAGYDLTKNFLVNLRYNLGLSNISDEEGGEIKGSVFSIGLGYKF